MKSEEYFEKIYSRIDNINERKLKKFIIYPFGYIGKLTKDILNNCFGIREKYVIDASAMCGAKHIDFLEQIDMLEYHILLACDNDSIYDEVLTTILKYVKRYQIIELFPRMQVGKYSYGPLCSQWLGIESIGAFCSFAKGTEVVGNHDVYISSHEFLSFPGDFTKHVGYVPGISVAKPRKHRKCKIGNDVWIGRNATIIEGCNIGNGVIIGAGAVVTKDIPDYAVAVGVPAKVIRYRYLPDQIEKLNKIAWWDWSEEKIRENYMDFYLKIDDFIEKHYVDK